MKKHSISNSQRPLYLVNIAVIAIAAAMYAALISPFSAARARANSGVPVYKLASDNEVTLLCAVSWEPSSPHRILDTLKKRGERITFAVGGELLKNDPETVRQMAEDGHGIAVMGMEPERDGDVRFVISDVTRSLDIAESILGSRPRLYYCGSRDPEVSAVAASRLSVTALCATIGLGASEHPGIALASALERTPPGGSLIAFLPTEAAADELLKMIEIIKNMGLSIVPAHKMLYN